MEDTYIHIIDIGDCCLLLIDKARAKDKTYIWVSVRWKTQNQSWGIYAPRIHWVARGTGTPKDRDDVNRRDVCECDGWACVLEVIGVPSIFKLIRKTATLARVLPTFDFCWAENAARRKWNMPRCVCAGWTPEAAKKRSVSQWACKNKSRTNSLCNLPDVLAIVGLHDRKDCCLLLIDKARATDKTHIWVSVRWKTKD